MADAASSSHARIWVALILTTVSGYVDSVGYIFLAKVLVANMSGNTVAIGRGLIEGDFNLLFRRGFAIPVFVLGMIASRGCFKFWCGEKILHAIVTVFALEAFFLGCFAALGDTYDVEGVAADTEGWFYYLLIFLPTIAMGLQNAALTHFGPLTVRTTHVTGTLAKFAEAVVNLASSWGAARRKHRVSLLSPSAYRSLVHEQSFKDASALFGTWFLYLIGATLGALLKEFWGLACMILPIGGLVVVVAATLIHPNWVEEMDRNRF